MDLATTWSINLCDKIYIKIDSDWFDLTNYCTHPGGINILQKYHLKDATKAFNIVKGHYDFSVDSDMKKYCIQNKKLIAYLNSFCTLNV